MKNKFLLALTLVTMFNITSGTVFASTAPEITPVELEKNSSDFNCNTIIDLLEYGENHSAKVEIQNILSQKPNCVDAQTLKILLKINEYSLDIAQNDINKLLELYPDNANLHYAQGMIYMNRKSSSDAQYRNNHKAIFTSAKEEFKKVINLDSSYYQAYNALGKAYYNLGDYENALTFFNKTLELNSDFAPAYDNVGLIYIIKNNQNEARINFEKAIALNPLGSTTMYHLAQLNAVNGNYSEALQYINESLAINPNSSPAYSLQGQIYLEQQNQAAAINSLEKAISTQPENSFPYIYLSDIYITRGDNEHAISILNDALDAIPNNSNCILKIADLYLSQNKYEQAIIYYSKLLNNQNFITQANLGLINCYWEAFKRDVDLVTIYGNEEFTQSINSIKKAIEIEPNNPRYYLALIKLEKLANQNSDIEFELPEAFDTVEENLYLGEILLEQNNYEAATKIYQKVLTSDVNNKTAQDKIAYINSCKQKSDEYLASANKQFIEKNYTNAIINCEKAIETFENTAEISFLQAKSYECLKEYEKALTFYELSLEIDAEQTDNKLISKKIISLNKKIKN
ncbi:MAG: tetratricopeptide repeat protein [Candidatus Gastranaerophilales bacterium]